MASNGVRGVLLGPVFSGVGLAVLLARRRLKGRLEGTPQMLRSRPAYKAGRSQGTLVRGAGRDVTRAGRAPHLAACRQPTASKRVAGRQGFTLLELLLALLLLVALLAAIGLAVGVQLRATDTGRSDVAQAQLARAILRQMADDLRGAIWYEPLDVSAALSGLTGAAGGAALPGGAATTSESACELLGVEIRPVRGFHLQRSQRERHRNHARHLPLHQRAPLLGDGRRLSLLARRDVHRNSADRGK